MEAALRTGIHVPRSSFYDEVDRTKQGVGNGLFVSDGLSQLAPMLEIAAVMHLPTGRRRLKTRVSPHAGGSTRVDAFQEPSH